ncbi:efflux RND transporter periplasmic adaptor subunit [Pararhodospirillum oryzae]|uniref:MexE family multidrug efflux RND transporter periplasmic adaptor subunit n=1 Tax=Pararhodospirillum oryzae TaxID=478448 RepID=A0A512H4L2_9PROT|nr:efflux RND transporter periplasmic adaptor subunit [Pararhodospirillum oryzae]GEO80377.1 MexE family multidrug efflux RND transporter periplasmic adaptor subunit [Pararhodospirillum oryzae]
MLHRLSVAAFVVCVFVFSFLLIFRGGAVSQPEGASSDAPGPTQVVTARLTPERVVLVDELPGRVVAYRRVEIRPQVGGLIKRRFAKGGTQVEAGDILFEIDPALLLADLETARAGLTRAEGAVEHARRGMERAEALVASNATSRKNYEDARNELATAQANLAEARAVVRRRQLDLDFATIRSPVKGYVGLTLADEGALASTSSQTELAVVQELDRVYVDLRVPATKLDGLQSAARQGLGQVEILDAKGNPHPRPGTLVVSDVAVDSGTGNATVRIEAENPGLQLLPGMYVRARLPRGLLPDAVLVPEDAVIRTGAGEARIVVVAADGRAEQRDVVLGEAVGRRLVVTSGLKAGEVIVVRGQDRVQDGMTVNPATAARDAAPATAKR